MKFSTIFGWFLPLLIIFLILNFFPQPILPTPKTFLTQFVKLTVGPIWWDLFYTSSRSIIAFFLSLIFGLLLSFFLRPQSTSSKLFVPSILLIHTSPVIVWIVPLVLFFGISHITPILATTFVVLPVIFFEFRTAFSASTLEKKEFWKHYVPNFKQRIILRLKLEWLPYLLNCVSVGFLLSFKASVIAEWFSAQNGLGKKMQQAFLHVDLASFLTYSLYFVINSLFLSYSLKKFFEQFSLKAPKIENSVPKSLPQKIGLNKITFSYGKKIILKNLSIELKEKEILFLSGPSGSGKTTLAKLLVGILNPQFGSANLSPENTKLLYQSDIVFANHTVKDNIFFFLPEEKYKKATELIENLGLKLDQKANELSGGMKRRLSLARTLLQEAKFLILDEPFSQLDRESVLNILKILLKEKQKGRGILIISHEHQELIKQFATKNYFLTNQSLKLISQRKNKI